MVGFPAGRCIGRYHIAADRELPGHQGGYGQSRKEFKDRLTGCSVAGGIGIISYLVQETNANLA